MKRTVIFNYYGMGNVGGIEKYINEVTGALLNSDVRIIWLRERDSRIAQSFRNNMLNPRVEIIEVTQKGIHWFSFKGIDFSKDEEVTIVSCSPLDMGRAIYIAKKYKDVNIKLIYAVPNTTGNVYYIERYFKNPVRNIVANRMAKIIKKWETAGSIVFFSKGQIEPLENAYRLNVHSKKEKLLPHVMPIPELDKKKLINRAQRDPFRIVTVGRFDFPHKGYMLGLIEAYGKLKTKYPNMKLDIIGFGPDEALVKKEIAKLSNDAQKDLRLLGEVAPENISQYFDSASLNISVAGGCMAGVKLGVLSIPARNYCSEGCEVYGFLPENRHMIVSTAPGKPAEDFIEQVIQMSDQEYMERSQIAHDEYKKSEIVNPYYFLERNCKSDQILCNSDLGFLRAMHYLTKIIDYLQIKRNNARKGRNK